MIHRSAACLRRSGLADVYAAARQARCALSHDSRYAEPRQQSGGGAEGRGLLRQEVVQGAELQTRVWFKAACLLTKQVKVGKGFCFKHTRAQRVACYTGQRNLTEA